MPATTKEYLHNFSAPHIYETCFYNVQVGFTNDFYFCPCVLETFSKHSVLYNSIIYKQKDEVICCCLKCKKKVVSQTNYCEAFDNYFDNLKKLLIQYFVVYDSYEAN